MPNELRRLPEVRWARYGSGILLVGVSLLMPFRLTPRNLSLVGVIMIYAIIGISLVILTGWAGNVSLGQWAIVGVGALVGGRLATGANPQDFFVVLILAGLAGAAVALVIGLPALRIRGLFLGVTTLAFAVAAGHWFFTFDQLTLKAAVARPVLFGVWDVSTEKAFYFVCLTFLVMALSWAVQTPPSILIGVFLAAYAVLLLLARRAGVAWPWIASAALLVVVPLLSGTVESDGRFGMAAFAFYWVLARLVRRPWLEGALQAGCLALVVWWMLVLPLASP